ncbi:MAG: glycosyltransferase family 4 protein [Deltaproteobacteria bacterium]|nr:glycosyltransferase family 4 protein [Deltaproteobacteria bacterium]
MMDRPLRFCMITTFYPPYNFGGDGVYVHRLSNELARLGHKVDVIHCIDSYKLLARREPENGYNDHPNVTVHGLRSPYGFLSPLATQQTGFPLFKSRKIRQILDKGFDVIHYHNISLVGGPKILECGKGLKLYTMHEYWLVCPTHVLFKFNREPCTSPECFLCNLIYKRPPQLWRHYRLLPKAVKHVDTFIAPSRFSRDTHRRMGLDARIVHLPYFLPDIGDNRRMDTKYESEPKTKRPYFLFAGRLEKIKGPQTLIPVFRHYGGARLLIAGKGNYAPELRKLAGENSNIEFLGFLTHDRLAILYRNAVATIVPSLCFDVFPNVVLETFRQKTPVIVRNLGGMPEFIEDSGGGSIYNNVSDLIAEMDYYLENPEESKERGEKGYRAYERLWSSRRHLDRYFDLINDIKKWKFQNKK